MYTVLEDNKELFLARTLNEAMIFAKGYDCFVTIKGPDFEVVGKFGVDTVADGKCPDGIEYDWNKAGRIGSARNK